ncbi:MAG: hypothetical protein LBK18_02610 [Prevotellaceae bacterium]|jgi:hypothetical protein|nr:hypothetical protein [Prevotellaceae bacterium]
MKKSLIAMALMFGAVVFLMPSCGSDDDDAPAKTYECSCSNASYDAKKTGLTEAEKTNYEAGCAASTPAAATSVQNATPKTVPTASCK